MRRLLLVLLIAVPACVLAQHDSSSGEKPMRLSDIKGLDAFPVAQRPITTFDFVLGRIRDAAARQAGELVILSLLEPGIELDIDAQRPTGGAKYVRKTDQIVIGITIVVRKVSGPWEKACHQVADYAARFLFTHEVGGKQPGRHLFIENDYFPWSLSASKNEQEVQATHMFAEAISRALTIRVVFSPVLLAVREERNTWRECILDVDSGSFSARTGPLKAMSFWNED